MLEQELKFYAEHLQEWLPANAGRVALIKGERLYGFFDSEDAALKAAVALLGVTSFLIRRIAEKDPTLDAPAYSLGLLRAVS